MKDLNNFWLTRIHLKNRQVNKPHPLITKAFISAIYKPAKLKKP